jgi:hypothetical protein
MLTVVLHVVEWPARRAIWRRLFLVPLSIARKLSTVKQCSCARGNCMHARQRSGYKAFTRLHSSAFDELTQAIESFA